MYGGKAPYIVSCSVFVTVCGLLWRFGVSLPIAVIYSSTVSGLVGFSIWKNRYVQVLSEVFAVPMVMLSFCVVFISFHWVLIVYNIVGLIYVVDIKKRSLFVSLFLYSCLLCWSWQLDSSLSYGVSLLCVLAGAVHILIAFVTRDVPLVLLITDIGHDMDDTWCLLLLRGLEKKGLLKLVGVVACGGNNNVRARVAKYVLGLTGARDLPIAVSSTGAREAVNVPNGSPIHVPTVDACELILSCARQYEKKLWILVAAECGPVAAARQVDKDNVLDDIGLLAIQGQPIQNGKYSSFNITENVEAYEYITNVNPIRCSRLYTGKYAAYDLMLRRPMVDRIQAACDIAGIRCDFVSMTCQQMNIFRSNDPDIFNRVYPLLPDENSDELVRSSCGRYLPLWFLSLKKVSALYDPAMAFSCFFPQDFRSNMSRRGVGEIGTAPEDSGVIEPSKTLEDVVDLMIRGLLPESWVWL